MTLPDALYLRHMLDAIDRVIEATNRATLEDFNRDWMIQDAIVHELQILGEAAGRISRELTDQHPEIPWRKVTGLRHKVVHDYFAVDLKWSGIPRPSTHPPFDRSSKPFGTRSPSSSATTGATSCNAQFTLSPPIHSDERR